MTSTNATLDPAVVRELADRVTGAVLAPDHPDFDDTRHVFVRHLDSTPAVIVRPTDAADVAAAVEFARQHDLELAVRSGGHSGAGHGSVDGGLVIDVRDLDTIDVDPATDTVWVGSGATAGSVTEALAEHGLVVGFGDTGSVGVGGITLGGGQGFLSRAHGLTVDNLLAVEVVTADGRTVTASDDEHADLFWALRGGGGNFGVATRFRFRAHRLSRVYGGMLMLPATADVVAGAVRLGLEAPDELSVIVNVMPAPPMPFIPAEAHGSVVVMVLATYAGPAADAEPVLAPFRELATPLADFLQEMPYSGMFQPEDPDYHPVAVARNGFADAFDRDDAQMVLDTIRARVAGPDVQMAVTQLRPLGGAVARVADDATAYAHRQRALMFNVAAIVGDVAALDGQVAWLEAFAAGLRDGTPGAYAGFIQVESPDRVHDVYPAQTYARLAQVKCAWDPDNVFHRNINVAPAS